MLPLLPIDWDRMPWLSDAVRTAAPAPSPNRTHVPLSVQSTSFDKVSAPISSAFSYIPLFIKASAICTAYRKPEQAALMSNATAWAAPSNACTWQAVLGVSVSDEIVATIKSCISSAFIPAFKSAFFAAPAAKDVVVSSFTRCRFRIPVRSVIHSSLVSTMVDR